MPPCSLAGIARASAAGSLEGSCVGGPRHRPSVWPSSVLHCTTLDTLAVEFHVLGIGQSNR